MMTKLEKRQLKIDNLEKRISWERLTSSKTLDKVYYQVTKHLMLLFEPVGKGEGYYCFIDEHPDRQIAGLKVRSKRYHSLYEFKEGVKQRKKIHSELRFTGDREKRYNRDYDKRLVTKFKLLDELLEEGVSLSKACKQVSLEYKIGKYYIEELKEKA